MIEIERHIEILLLSHDCVIVPGLGAFVAHRISAHYDGSSMVPPMRVIGFNPQLVINDSTLVYSYVDAYDMSYPDALRRVEREVEEIRMQIGENGRYEFNNIGVLSIGEGDSYLFEPSLAGLLTPELYGLAAYDICQTESEATTFETEKPGKVESVVETVEDTDVTEQEDSVEQEGEAEEDERVIRIPISYLRNIAAAAVAVVAFFLITTPVANSGDFIECSIVGSYPFTSQSTAITKADSVSIVIAQAAATTTVEKPAVADNYCIILASMITKKNADTYIEMLSKDGYDGATTFTREGILRVGYGSYATETEAYNALYRLRRTSTKSYFDEAWVYKK